MDLIAAHRLSRDRLGMDGGQASRGGGGVGRGESSPPVTASVDYLVSPADLRSVGGPTESAIVHES